MIKKYFEDHKFQQWNIQTIDTGLNTMTGGRIKRIENHIDDTFCVTYGDGVSDVNINDLILFHKEKKSLATLTAIHPPERFGVLELSGNNVVEFHEKQQGKSSWINGGFFVCKPNFMDLIKDNSTVLESEPLENVAKDNQLVAYKHNGFWQCMDTKRDKDFLDELWANNNAPWTKI